jgi:hypothetical protein
LPEHRYYFLLSVIRKKEQLLDLHYQMVISIHRVQEYSAELYQSGKIGGFMNLYIGIASEPSRINPCTARSRLVGFTS